LSLSTPFPLSPLLSHAPAPSDFYTLSLHDALPICSSSIISLHSSMHSSQIYTAPPAMSFFTCFWLFPQKEHLSRSALSCIRAIRDRKSTRLNSSHVSISYAVFCLKKKIKYVSCMFV